MGAVGMETRYEEAVVKLSESLKASFIESNGKSDDRYAPRILGNDSDCDVNVLDTLKRELCDCTSFALSVAFITASGIQVLAAILAELRDRGIPGRILTSTYLNFNDPDALGKLLEYPNIESRVYQGDLHAKGYFFNKDQISTIIIGSSNLTQTALTCNKEWNILFRSFPDGRLYLQAKEQYEQLWNDEEAVPLTKRWIADYRRYLEENPRPKQTRSSRAFRDDAHEAMPLASDSAASASRPRIVPNKMQQSALEALSVLHGREEPRALLVSATGSGKTYLSALDVERQRPGKVLFVAHRQRILSASLHSYERVLGDAYRYGLLAGDKRPGDATCVFAMVETLRRRLDEYAPDAFDYIIIDEAHRAGALGYREILDHFTPRFVLGMTATPSRTDGYDVYSLFNHVIAYRITLQDALDSNLLTPFHYFGIADLEIDDEAQDDFTLFNKLTSKDRINHVIDKIEEYSVQKTDRKGLVFCSRNDEAACFAEAFTKRGLPSVAISGKSTDAQRDEAILQLEAGEICYIFSVDIMNEGVDIPAVNQIIMLRKTESTIVFVQQLGRGLRKIDGKEFTLVLDFIGNYQQNYLVPMALSGDRTYNKDTLRKIVKEGTSIIPGCSTVTFDKVSEQRIFKALDEGRFSDAKLIKTEYEHLKQLLGRIPRLCEFDENDAIDPLLIIKKYGSYAAFLQKYEKGIGHVLSERKLDYLKFVSTKLANGKRLEDLLALRDLISTRSCISSLDAAAAYGLDRSVAVRRMLTGEFSTAGQQLVANVDSAMRLSEAFASALRDEYFKDCVLDALEFGVSRACARYGNHYRDTDFVLYEKYSLEEICKLLRWEEEPKAYINISGYRFDRSTNTFPVFVNYDKSPDISVTTRYEDRFISRTRFIAISKSRRTLESPEIKRLMNWRENEIRVYLFVRKNKDDGDGAKEFYFLGQMHPTGEFEQVVMGDGKTSAVEITYELDQPVRADLYDYPLSSFDA